MVDSLESVKRQVLEINAQEVIKARNDGQSDAMIKRLTLDDKVFQTMLSRLRKVVSRVEEPRKIGEKIWRRIALYPTQQKRASYGPLFCPKQTLFKSPGHPSSITLVADLQLCLVLHAVALGRIPDSG